MDGLANPDAGDRGAAGKEDRMLVEKAAGEEEEEEEGAGLPYTEADAEAALKLW